MQEVFLYYIMTGLTNSTFNFLFSFWHKGGGLRKGVILHYLEASSSNLSLFPSSESAALALPLSASS